MGGCLVHCVSRVLQRAHDSHNVMYRHCHQAPRLHVPQRNVHFAFPAIRAICKGNLTGDRSLVNDSRQDGTNEERRFAFVGLGRHSKQETGLGGRPRRIAEQSRFRM